MPKKSAKKAKPSVESPAEIAEELEAENFESQMAELEQIVAELEGGELGLNEAMEKYEKGVQFLKRCYETLKNAEQKVELLSMVDESGEVKVLPFDETARG